MHEKLLRIQLKLKANKNQYNDFGGYYYRSLEDILVALKPLLKEEKLTLIITDEIVNIGDRFYIKAIARLIDVETKEEIESVAYAREAENKKGMDESQITGSTSSYARKYALNGLLLIDDNKDADFLNKGDEVSKERKIKIARINQLLVETNTDKQKFLEYFKAKDVWHLSDDNLDNAIKLLERKKNGKK